MYFQICVVDLALGVATVHTITRNFSCHKLEPHFSFYFNFGIG